MRTRSIVIALAAAAACVPVASAVATGDAERAGGEKTWQVTVDNLTTGQPLSPPLTLVHRKGVHVFRPGGLATNVLALIAEEGNAAPAASAYASDPRVRSSTVAGMTPIPPGMSRTFTVTTRGHAQLLSLASMLGITNDGFWALDAANLHDGAVWYAGAWDAGSERNTESAAHLAALGSPGVRAPEGAPIAPHPGIAGIADLDPAVHGWSDPVARISVTLVS